MGRRWYAAWSLAASVIKTYGAGHPAVWESWIAVGIDKGDEKYYCINVVRHICKAVLVYGAETELKQN